MVLDYGLLGLDWECYFRNDYQIQDLNILVDLGMQFIDVCFGSYVSRFVFC
jgi:hypothetical protein